uniref:SAYSvFN domain-containing protein n=1 Tax=Amblyomma americanum TaxID=6943 RepID=A0A0C9R0S3_AMBAM
MEEELAKFRARLREEQKGSNERRPELSDSTKSPLQSDNTSDRVIENTRDSLAKLRKKRTVTETPMASSRIMITDEPVVDEQSCTRWTKLDVATFAAKLTLWCLLMTLFVVLEFGAVFFVASVFYVMFTNFRKRPRVRGELSAYSVFNPNVEAIDGSVTAQDLERQLTMGILPLH